MKMEIKNTDNTNSTATPGAEEKTAKTFTQDELNAIVSERLKREKESIMKQLEQREKDLQTKENVFECKEYLSQNGYPVELMEIFNAENRDDFITRVSAMVEKFPDFYKGSEQSEEKADTESAESCGDLPSGFHKVNTKVNTSVLNSFHPYVSNPTATPLKRDEESGKIRRAFGID